ncbi:hypothetical protein SAMN06265365_11010 [Tistlia consotensis]|uniref:Uncharacterized protein n=1 Tax=Tistlia consotensis USBA 355 TaxID=560819 RepID=A0A1Y6BZ49_9PROT|nr:hypothetical protein [Tistlia consotensis]SMF28085.1 hypothetical protein SAMN05428998_109146 [Tistlia consotensis USBA 355]SNR65199.1 hypothetical protein SAMN06265365_11010 [Tistlia consotensis]
MVRRSNRLPFGPTALLLAVLLAVLSAPGGEAAAQTVPEIGAGLGTAYGCLPFVDLSQGLVVPRRRSWNDRQLGGCEPDRQRAPIALEAGGPACSWRAVSSKADEAAADGDLESAKPPAAVPRSRFGWTTADGVFVDVTGCRDSGSPAPLTWTERDCPRRDDWQAGRTYLWRRALAADGSVVLGCREGAAALVLQHRREACAPLWPFGQGPGKLQVLQERVVASDGTLTLMILDCQPSGLEIDSGDNAGKRVLAADGRMTGDALGLDLVQKTAPCEGRFLGDLHARVSYPGREWWLGGNGKEGREGYLKLTECVPDPDPERMLPILERPAGWRHDPAVRASEPLVQLVGFTGPADDQGMAIGAPFAEPGRALAWQHAGFQTQATGQTVSLGCWRIALQRRLESWRLPDGSTRLFDGGPAEAVVAGGCGSQSKW